MKYKNVWIIAAIICGGFLAFVASITACSQEQRTTILVEGTITDEQGNAMNGVTAYVTFSRRRAEDRYSELQSFEETVDSSFRFEGKGDGVVVIFARKGYAPGRILLNRDDSGDLIRRDLSIIMKKISPEKQTELVFGEIDSWSHIDCIVIEDGEKLPTTEDSLEKLRKEFGLEKSDMTDTFVKAIRDYLSVIETNSENSTLRGWHFYAMYHIQYYPPPQQEFLELIRKTVELEPESADRLIHSYTKAYPDWVFDDETILDLTSKSSKEWFNLDNACSDLIIQVRNEKDETRKKKLLDKAREWAFHDDKLESFHEIDRLLLDHDTKEYAVNPARKLQLAKNLEMYEKKKYYGWEYRRTKYALEHFGEGDEAFETLYKMDTDRKLRDGEWERSERDKRLKEGFEEAEKMGIDLSTVLGPELYKKYQSFKASDKK